jgi:S-DNA-T family DNA segregation ATPase FtsK/SpoIIIE
MRGSTTREFVVAPHRPSLVTLVLKNLGILLAAGVILAVRHPAIASGLMLTGIAFVWLGGVGIVVLVVVAVGGLLGWRRWHRRSYRRVVTSRYRGAMIYRRRWQPAMVTCGLAAHVNGREYLPTILSVTSSETVDQVLVRLLSGQAPEDFERATSELAHTFEALRCKVAVEQPGRIWLEFTHVDPLNAPIAALEPEPSPDLMALPVGRCENGAPWSVRLIGSHLLIAGATGAGKGSVMWSLVRAMGPRIRDGSVQVWAVDPKGGMELTPGASLFTRFAYDSPESMVTLLEDAVAFMRTRAERLRQAGERVHTPTTDDPLVVIVVDEIAALTAYLGDRELRRRAESALQVLLSQGRAPGVLVVAAVQDPGKDVIDFRDLFPTRIALRLLEDVQVDMVLGRSAREHGAECDQIPASLPGIGYVVLEGIREPVRVRAAYVSDADLADMITRYSPADGKQRHLNLVGDEAS